MTYSHDELSPRPVLSDDPVDACEDTPSHGVMVAPCRMSKSVMMNWDIANRLDRGGAIFILDPHGSYRGERDEAVS